jgi:hypothetical protein
MSEGYAPGFVAWMNRTRKLNRSTSAAGLDDPGLL